MTRTRHWTATALVTLTLAAGCGGAAEAPPPQYGYGDMFQGQDEDSRYRNDVSGSYAAAETAAAMEPGASYGEESVEMEDSMPPPSPEPADDDTGDRGWRQREASPPPPPAQLATTPQGGPSPATTTENVPEGRPAEVARPSGGEPAANPQGSGREPVAEGVRERRAPMLIYEAGLTIATRTVPEQVDEAVRITHELGGVIVTQDDAGVMVRVPAGRFREALGLYEALGDVLARRVTAQDVSEQVRDTRVRLQNAINLRDRLRELLRSATTVPESLAIERELERLNEVIALLQGQLESLEERVAYSTITIRFQAVQDDAEVPREQFRLPFEWLHNLGLPALLNL